MSIETDKIAQILVTLGEPTPDQAAELRRLLPPVDQGARPATGNLRVGGRRRR